MYILSYINTIEIYIVKLYPQVVLNTKKEFNSTFTIYFEIVIQMYGGWLRPCEKKVILFPQYNILFPQFIILFPQERYFVPTRKILCSFKLCESSCPYLCKHHTTDKRQIQNKRKPESRKYLLSLVSYLMHLLLFLSDYYTTSPLICLCSFYPWLGWWGLRSHKTCTTPPHIRVDVQSQAPHRH